MCLCDPQLANAITYTHTQTHTFLTTEAFMLAHTCPQTRTHANKYTANSHTPTQGGDFQLLPRGKHGYTR